MRWPRWRQSPTQSPTPPVLPQDFAAEELGYSDDFGNLVEDVWDYSDEGESDEWSDEWESAEEEDGGA